MVKVIQRQQTQIRQIPTTFFVVTSKVCRASVLSDRAQRGDELPAGDDGRVRDHSGALDPHTTLGPIGLHLRVLREVADVLVQLLSISSQRSWRSGRSPTTGERPMSHLPSANLRNHRPASLLSVPGKIKE